MAKGNETVAAPTRVGGVAARALEKASSVPPDDHALASITYCDLLVVILVAMQRALPVRSASCAVRMRARHVHRIVRVRTVVLRASPVVIAHGKLGASRDGGNRRDLGAEAVKLSSEYMSYGRLTDDRIPRLQTDVCMPLEGGLKHGFENLGHVRIQ